MPIVVDEVVISVEAQSPAPTAARAPGAPAPAPPGGEDPQALVADCVERVLEILAQRGER